MVYRIYVEKKPGFDVEAEGLKNELVSLLGIQSLSGVRLLNRYDVEGIDRGAVRTSAPPRCSASRRWTTPTPSLPQDATRVSFAVEYLPGQFDQRADSAAECIQLISQGERPLVRSAKVYLLRGRSDRRASWPRSRNTSSTRWRRARLRWNRRPP